MYIKWMVCDVKNNHKENFSFAQEQWIGIQNAEGLIGQIGGWDINHANVACVISFWDNEKSVNKFMREIHDEIFLENHQSQYYNSIKVEYFNSIISMEGESGSLFSAMKDAKFLRIAECMVKQESINHFERVQKEIWLPGMKNSKGILGGKFVKSANNKSKYLVATLWNSSESHDDYVENNLHKLRIRANVQNDIDTILGRQIALVDSWKVIRTKTNN